METPGEDLLSSKFTYTCTSVELQFLILQYILQDSVSETIVFLIINNALKSVHFYLEEIEYLAIDSNIMAPLAIKEGSDFVQKHLNCCQFR